MVSALSILYHPTSMGGAKIVVKMFKKKSIKTRAIIMFVLGFLSFTFDMSSVDRTEDIDPIPMLLDMPIMKILRITANMIAPTGLMLTSRMPVTH
ncbi:MAG: hypothetical protein KAJ56_04725, partial [Candidatus Aenigmarchaeota archaeon]|nr:hypothetical protein [Candidatus Aenigmarchaeota archaeon]